MQKTGALASAALFTVLAFSLAPDRAAAAITPPGDPGNIGAYARVLRKINPRLQSWQSTDLAHHVLISAARWNVDANLLVALVTVESRWRPSARSRVGALGLGQLMPGTAHALRVNPRVADQNLAGCAQYLSGLISKYVNHPNRFALAFAAYNAGPKAVSRYHGIPPFSETQHYVVRVMRMWGHLTRTLRLPLLRPEPLEIPANPSAAAEAAAPPADQPQR